VRRVAQRAWPILAIAATLALGLACLSEALSPPPFAGFLTYRNGAVASLARADWPGFRAGLAVRDTIVEVAGQKVAGGPAIAKRLAELPLGSNAEIVAVSPTGIRRAVNLPVARFGRADLGFTFYLPFGIGLLYLALGSAIFWVKRDRAATLTFAVCLVASAFYLSMFDAHTSFHASRVWISYPLLGPLSIHLFAIFPERRKLFARPSVLAVLYLAAGASIAWRQLTIDDPRGSDYANIASSWMLAAEFLIILGLLGVTFRRTASPAVRNRAKTTFVGMALTVSVVVAWQFASRIGPPVMTADRAMIASGAFPLLITYALLRRNLFDIDAVLRASLIYGLATALVLSVYFAAVALIGVVMAPLARRWAFGEWAAVASTMLAAVLFHPLRTRVQRGVDRILLGGKRAVAEELAALATALPAPGDLPTVAEDVVKRLQNLVGARWVALLFGDPRGGELELTAVAGSLPADPPEGGRVALDPALVTALDGRDDPVALRDLSAPAPLGAELVVPLRAGGAAIGLVAVGPRRSSVYRYGALQALAKAARPVALALDHGRLLAERAARERLAALGSMAAVIVHEVKNPLGIIKVSAGTLKKRARDENAAELARCIEDEVDRMDVVCRRLLELGRPPATSLAPCDLAGVIKETVALLAADFAGAGVRVTCDLADAKAPIRADAGALRQVLINLLYNARDSMVPGGGDLSVRLQSRAGAVDIAVADTGRGMDEATRRQLFRPFFTTRHGGTGLGLAIVKRIVEEHHGAVHVDSRVGEGSRFVITLPA
jgi:signal transduction histidine kinase